MNEFHLLRPLVLLFLIPVLIIIWRTWKSGAGDSQWHELIDSNLLTHLLDKPAGVSRRWPTLLLGLILSLLVIAAAGPTWQRLPQQVEQKEDALVIVLDLSLSMRATDIKPSRIARAQHKLRDILNNRKEGLTALVVYAGDAHTVAPFTDDADTIEAMVTSLLPEIMPKLGSRPDLGILSARQLMQDGGILNARLLLVSDELNDADVRRIETVLGNDIALSLMSIGTAAGGPIQLPQGGFFKNDDGTIVIPKLNTNNFRKLASNTGGRYSDFKVDSRDLDYLLKQGLDLDTQTSVTDREFDVWLDRGPWLVLFCLPFALLAFRRGWLIAIACVCIIQPQPAMAFEWSDLWSTKDQQGQKHLEQGDASAAAATFKDPVRKGAAHYQAGEYKEALEQFSNQSTATSLYNRGNALARSGDLKQASESYAKSLEMDPDNEDALFNKELVDKLLEQQQQQQQNQEQQQDQENQEQQDQQQSDSQEQSEQEQSEQEQQQSEQEQQQQEQSESEQSEESEEEQQEQEQEQAEEEQQEGEQGEEQQQQITGEELSEEELDEAEQALEQWLRKVPDDPGGLLRQKFRYQSEQNKRNREYVDDQSKVW